jgi:uncharacterized protein YunC (DUF1805 family)
VFTPDDILRGELVEVSQAAAAAGISVGMNGREALERMKLLPPAAVQSRL